MMMMTAPLPQVLEPHPSNAEILRLLQKYPPNAQYAYGTAGFRLNHELLPSVMVRVGLLATLRSYSKQQAVGVMVTASHNDETYNGVKMADPNGGMMDMSGEEMATKMANEPNAQKLLDWFVQETQTFVDNTIPILHLGRDTRDHSPSLACLVIKAARAAGCRVVDHGVVTTPALHHCVLHFNFQNHLPCMIPHRPNLIGYYDLLAYSYQTLLSTCSENNNKASKDSVVVTVLVDCACGVGYPALQYLACKLQTLGITTSRQFVATNSPDAGPLNHNCGSEHVQKSIAAPTWYDEDAIQYSKKYCVSLDGDADRIVFFSENTNNDFVLLDGDKIACLICQFLQHELQILQEAMIPALPAVQLGVVQTAYANGASTTYLQEVLGKDHVLIAKTGVKHVHAAAHEHFDVGVYFEANGHGTILFGSAFYQMISVADTHLREQQQSKNRSIVALQRLRVLPALVNQAVGDALSDLLLVDAILQIQNWNLEDWNNMYTDLPSRQCKVKVQDRTMIRTNDNETKCLEPANVQTELDQAMSEYNGRAFVRPSGTEDVVRVYAEAPSRQAADALATRAADIVYRNCQGVGELPVFPSSRM